MSLSSFWFIAFFILSVVNGQSFNQRYITVTEEWEIVALHQRCGAGTYVIPVDKGANDLNTREACAEKCEQTIGCVHFGWRGTQASKCDYYTAACNVLDPDAVSNEIILGSKLEDEIWTRSVNLPSFRAISLFSTEIDNKVCGSSGQIISTKGYNTRNTRESCAYECVMTYGDTCVSFAFQNEKGTETSKRCIHNHKNCRSVAPVSAHYNSDSVMRMYNLDGMKFTPKSLDSSIQARYDGNYFDKYVVGADECAVKRITYGSTSSTIINSQMKCASIDSVGLLHTTGFDYNVTVDDISVCGSLCYDWNLDSMNTAECRGFNKKTDPGNNTRFKCMLYECNIYTLQDTSYLRVYNPPDTETINDEWGYLDDWYTPHCRGQFRDSWEKEMTDHYDLYRNRQCDAGSEVLTAILSTNSAGECAARCMGYYNNDCSTFKITKDRECILYKKCSMVDDFSDPHSYVFVRKNYRTIYQNDDNYITIYPKSTCAKNGDAVLYESYNDVDYSVRGCLDKCLVAGNVTCQYFHIDENQNCNIYSNCGGVGPVSQLENQNVTDSQMTYSISTTTPAPTLQPTPRPTLAIQCVNSGQCLENDTDFCNNEGQCVTLQCTKHSDCYGSMLTGRLPLCDLKKKSCVDLYSSNCKSPKSCQSHAKRKWRKNGIFAKSQISNNEEKESKRREATKKVIEQVKGFDIADNIYIGIIGKENVEIDSAMVAAVNDTELILNSILETYCGTEYDSCTLEIDSGNGRRLADENITVTLSYDVDDLVYFDLINSGYDFGTNNFTNAIAQLLGLNPEDVVILSNNGNIDIEITVIDDVIDGEPIGYEFIDDLTIIQNQLSTIKTALGNELNYTGINLDEIDYCGDRDCSGLGTCDALTGYCNCPKTHLGVNCEILIACNGAADFCKNGGTCPPDGERCHCVFPYFGPKCESFRTECDLCV